MNSPHHQISMRQIISRALRTVAQSIEGGKTGPTIEDIRAAQARAAEMALLDAENDLERAKFTVLMLRERLERLRRSDDESHPPTGLSAGARRRSAQGLCDRGSDHDGLPVPAGRTTVAEPQAPAFEADRGGFGKVRSEGSVREAPVV